MQDRLAALKDEFELLFRRNKKHVLVDEVGFFVSGCGCRGLRLRPGGLRTYLFDSLGGPMTDLLVGTCSDCGVTPTLGYAHMVPGSRDLVDVLYVVDACPGCRVNVQESQGLVPITIFFDSHLPGQDG